MFCLMMSGCNGDLVHNLPMFFLFLYAIIGLFLCSLDAEMFCNRISVFIQMYCLGWFCR